eukprot:1159637-Pelagomonas_calceolata.AAC.5
MQFNLTHDSPLATSSGKDPFFPNFLHSLFVIMLLAFKCFEGHSSLGEGVSLSFKIAGASLGIRSPMATRNRTLTMQGDDLQQQAQTACTTQYRMAFKTPTEPQSADFWPIVDAGAFWPTVDAGAAVLQHRRSLLQTASSWITAGNCFAAFLVIKHQRASRIS